MTDSLSSPNTVFGEDDDRIDQLLDAESYNRKHPYNFFGFKPVHDELAHAPVKITGELPEDLVGVYLRNGTNPQFEPSSVRYHMFDGAGMLHQIQIADGAATYSNTYIRTPRFEYERLVGREVYLNVSELVTGGKACLEKLNLIEEKKKSGLIPALGLDGYQNSTSVQYHHGRLFCFTEAGYPFAPNAKKEGGKLVLDGTGHFENWGGGLRSAFSAHPAIDPETGDFYSITTAFLGGTIDAAHVAQGKLLQSGTVHLQQKTKGRMSFLHDCFLTDRFLLFPDFSLRTDEQALLSKEGSVFYFDPSYKMRWGLLSRNFQDSVGVRWFETERPGMIWHLINAWEQGRPDGGTDIVLYAPRFESYPADIPVHTPAEPHAHINKWVLDVNTGKVTEDRTLLNWGYERPSINPAYRGKRNRYTYLLDEQRQGYMGKGVLKYDLLDECVVKYFDYGEVFGGEPLFVPRTSSMSEDDGYVIDLLMSDNKSELIIIDALTMEELARLHLPRRVPFGVHACWLDQKMLEGLA